MSMIRVSSRLRAALLQVPCSRPDGSPMVTAASSPSFAGLPAGPRLRSCPSPLIAVEARSQPDVDQMAGLGTRDSVLPCTHWPQLLRPVCRAALMTADSRGTTP
jgi:hypothetical protein